MKKQKWTIPIKLKEQKEPWNYDHPEHKEISKYMAEMMAIDSKPFSILEDTGFICLLAYVSPCYVAPLRNHFSEKLIP